MLAELGMVSLNMQSTQDCLQQPNPQHLDKSTLGLLAPISHTTCRQACCRHLGLRTSIHMPEILTQIIRPKPVGKTSSVSVCARCKPRVGPQSHEGMMPSKH